MSAKLAVSDTTSMICKIRDRRSRAQTLPGAGAAEACAVASAVAFPAALSPSPPVTASRRVPAAGMSATLSAETRYDPASTANAVVGPVDATRTPPITGPSVEPAWTRPV